MNIFTPLAFFAFILGIYMGIYVIRINSQTATNRVFLGLAISMAIWNFAYMFIYPDIDKSHVFFWYKVSALGWCFFPAFVLHFFLLLAEKKFLFRKSWMWVFLYLPGLIFSIKAMAGGFLAIGFEEGPGNSIYEIQNTDSIWYPVYLIYLWIYIFSGVLAFSIYSRQSALTRIKSQNKIFLVAVFVLFAVISTTNLLLPSLNIKIIPAIGNIVLILWMFTVWYAIVKYKLMSFTLKSAANKLISKMKELLFFVDTNGKIIRINDYTKFMLGMHSKEIINANFCDLVDDYHKIENIIADIFSQENIPELTLHLKCSGTNMLPVSLSFSGIKDKTGDPLGILIIGHDISTTIQLQDEIESRKEAELRIQQQNEKLIEQKEELQSTLANLKEAQMQLIQAEKMASLGELTAGIAHEIQNPLNFVTNFSEVCMEMVNEIKCELTKDNHAVSVDILDEVLLNLERINQHGKRADAIVKSMLQQSRSNSFVKEPTDINGLAYEFLQISYQDMKAKNNSFNAKLITDFDEELSSDEGRIYVILQDIGRVILNLLSNAFYSMKEKIKDQPETYEPVISVKTKKAGNMVELKVRDNGPGIPQKAMDKIFQPFFTTKPAGQGTGLGLSICYDIIVNKHGGRISVETEEGENSFTEFTIELPYHHR